MKLLPPKKTTGAKAAKPTPKPAKHRGAPAKPFPPKATAKPAAKAPVKAPAAVPPALAKAKLPVLPPQGTDPDMDGDAGANESAVAEQREPATTYARASRKSGPTVI